MTAVNIEKIERICMHFREAAEEVIDGDADPEVQEVCQAIGVILKFIPVAARHNAVKELEARVLGFTAPTVAASHRCASQRL